MLREALACAPFALVWLSSALSADQIDGLNIWTRTFTDPDQIEIADMIDPAQIKRTWDAAILRVPDGPGRSRSTDFNTLQAKYGDGDVRFPTAIYLHGCAGFWSGSLMRIKFLADNGFLVIAPASMARTVYTPGCQTETHSHSLFRPIIGMRQLDAGHAIEKARTLPYVDAENMVLIGLSEGGVTTSTFKAENEDQRVTARVVEGWTCNAGWYEYHGLNAPEDEPVLSLVASNDPWYKHEALLGDCGEFMIHDNGSRSVVYGSGPLSRRHELMENKAVQDETLAFLRQHLRLPLSIREAQLLLSKLGYDPGPVDGLWGRKTLTALNALRADKGLPPVTRLEHSSDALLRRLSPAD